MHGPRLSGRREPPKTVKFNERCDVMEFDRDEEDPSDDSVDDYGDDPQDDTPDDPFFAPPHEQDPPPQPDSSYESIDLSDTSLLPDTPMPLELDPDASITGLVDAMFAPASGTSTPPPPQLGSAHTRTFEAPPTEQHAYDHATDLDTEDGVPFGRSHHAARAAAFHERAPHPLPVAPPHLTSPRPLPRPGGATDAATPPRARVPESVSSPPLGRTTHLERRRAAAEDEEYDEADDADVARLPGSPSPAPVRYEHTDVVEIGIPRFSLPSGVSYFIYLLR
jgi:hypothetical protein